MRSGLRIAGVLAWLAATACGSGGSDVETGDGLRRDPENPKNEEKDASTMEQDGDGGDRPDAGEDAATARLDGGHSRPAPFEYASRLPAPTDVAVGETNIFWNASTSIWTAPLNGGERDDLAIRQKVPRGIVATKDHLYWINGGSSEVMVMPLPYGQPVSLASFFGGEQLQDLAVDSTYAYVTWHKWGQGDLANGGVVRIPLVEGDGARETLVSVDGTPRGIAVNATHVYWVMGGATFSVSSNYVTTYALGSVRRIAFAGGKEEVLAFDQNQPHSIALDHEFVYWTAEVDGRVMKVPLAGGTPVAIADGQDHPWDIQVDATHAYWTVYAGQVLRAPLAGGSPELLADLAPLNAGGIAIDQANVYVAAFKSSATPDGKVVRIEK